MRLIFKIMPKKPSEKNKAWEKERRDRLNKAFEQLAKLLPQYDPTVPWSKNEIIQKTVAYIEELHIKHESILKAQDPEALKEYNELLDTLKFFKSRNGQLAELLNKAKISIPPAKFPKFLTDNLKFGEENKLLEITTRPVGRPKKYSNEITAEQLKSLAEPQHNKNKSESNQLKNVQEKSQLETGPAAKGTTATVSTGAIISTGVLMPLIPCQPSALLPITTAPTLPSLVSVANGATYRKCKILSIQTLPRLARLPKAKDGKVNILPRPVLKLHIRRSDGKVPIPLLKPKVVAVKRKLRRRRKPKQPPAVQKSSKRKQIMDKETTAVNEKVPKLSGSVESASIVKNIDPIPLVSADLPDDYFSTLQIPENNSNPSSVSPTAAFLLSFPVVSTTGVGGKNTDGSDEATILGDEQQRKSNVTEGLENLNNFFSTKEYYKYCGQTNEGAVSGKELEVKQSIAGGPQPNSSVTSVNTEVGPVSVSTFNSASEVPVSVTASTYNSAAGTGSEIPNLTSRTSMSARLPASAIQLVFPTVSPESCKAPASNSGSVFLVPHSTIPRTVVSAVPSETFAVNSLMPKVLDAVSSQPCISSNPAPLHSNSVPQSENLCNSPNIFPSCSSSRPKFSYAGGYGEPSTKVETKVDNQSSIVSTNSDTNAAKATLFSPHNNFSTPQSPSFSVSNIFSSSNSTAVRSQSTGTTIYQNTTPKSAVSTLSSSTANLPPFAQNMSLPLSQPSNFATHNSYLTLSSSKAVNQRSLSTVACPNTNSKSDSTTMTFTTISNAIPTSSPCPQYPTTSTAFLPSSCSAVTVTNSTKTTKPMQFTDYSSTFMPAVSVSTSTRSYAPLPLSKSSAKPPPQNASRPYLTMSTNESNSLRPFSFPISYNFGSCAESVSLAKSTAKPLHTVMSTMTAAGTDLLSTTSSLVTQSYIDPLLPSIDAICGPKLSSAVTSTTNYYFPLQTPAVTSSFTFNLTSTVSTATATTTATSLAQPFLNYPDVKQTIPWIPATTAVDYKPSFTFSLTPSSSTYTTTSQTINSSGAVKSFATLPAVKPSESIVKTTFDPLNSAKNLNPFSEPAVIPNSYSSTSFTFSLARPKTTVTVASDFAKPLPTCSTVDPKYQASYHPYNFDNYTNVYPKETTNFTFALTKPTQSFSSSFSIDSTLGVSSSYSSQPQPNAVAHSTDFHKNRNSKSSHFVNNQKIATTKDPPVNYYGPDQNKLTKVSQKSHVNWMTSSEVLQPMDIGQQPTSSYYPSHITPALDFNNKKIDSNCTSHGLVEDNNFSSWSPSKILDTSHLMASTTLPNYYSELNSLPPVGYENSKIYPKLYGAVKVEKPYKAVPNSTNQGNFFSVSQLVEQSTPNSKLCGGYHKKIASQKTKDLRKTTLCNSDTIHQNMYSGPKPVTLNNYSAEALICKKEKHRNYPPSLQHHHNSDYYTPHHDLANNSYMPQDTENLNNYNANYFYNYMPPNQNYVQETDYLGAYSGDMQYGKINNAPGSKSSLSSVTIKSEKGILPPHPAPPPNLMSYESNYLPVPPIGAPTSVVDAYEPHYYSHSNNFQHAGWNAAKNSLPTYHHGQGMLPAGDEVNLPNSNQAGTSNLTNFNLSAICPEINDKVEQSNW